MIGLIKHVVMWKLKENAQGNTKLENARLIKTKLENLKEIIQELKEIEVGINIVKDPAAYDLVLYTGFENQDDLNKYASDPRHLEVVDFIKKVVESRIVVDYQV